MNHFKLLMVAVILGLAAPAAAAPVHANDIASSAVTEVKIATGAVTATKIGTGAVTEAKLGAGSVTETKLGAGAVTATKIGAGAVDATALASDAVTTAKILALNVTGAKIAAATITNDKLDTGLMVIATDVTVTNAELLALQTTAKTLVASPGSNKALVFIGAAVRYVYASAAFGSIAAGDDLYFKYTDTGGGQVGVVESTGLLDQTSDKVVWAQPSSATSNLGLLTANAPLTLSLGGAVDTGGGELHVRVYYRVVATNF